MDEPGFHDNAVAPNWLLHDGSEMEGILFDIPGLESIDWNTMSNADSVAASCQPGGNAASGFPRDLFGETATHGLFTTGIGSSSSMDWTSDFVSAHLPPPPDPQSSRQHVNQTLEVPAVDLPALPYLPKHSLPVVLGNHINTSNSSGILSELQPKMPLVERLTEDCGTDAQQLQLPLRIVSGTDKAPGRGRALHSPQVWNSHKSTIKRLYIDEGKPLKEVMKTMEEQHSFKASIKMYKTKLGQWRFEKNNTEKEMAQILHVKFRRDTAGKPSSFIRNGKKIDIQRYLQRKGKTEYDLVDFETPAHLPNFIHCRTPSPSPEYLGSPEAIRHQELLLLHFRDVIQYQGRIHRSGHMNHYGVLDDPFSVISELDNVVARLRRAMTYLDQGSTALSLACFNEAYSSLDDFIDNPDVSGILQLLILLSGKLGGNVGARNVWKYALASSTRRLHPGPLHRLIVFVSSLIQTKDIDATWNTIKCCLQQMAGEVEKESSLTRPTVLRTAARLWEYLPYEATCRTRLLLRKIDRELQHAEKARKCDDELFMMLWCTCMAEVQINGFSNQAADLSHRILQIANSYTGANVDVFRGASFHNAYAINYGIWAKQGAKYDPRHEIAIYYLEEGLKYRENSSIDVEMLLKLESMYREAGWDEKAEQVMAQYEDLKAAFIAKWDGFT